VGQATGAGEVVQPATGYAYVLPGAWVHLDLDPDRLPASVDRALAARVRREPALVAHQEALGQVLRAAGALAAASGAERVSLLAERVGDLVVSAAVTFGVHDRPEEWALPARTRRHQERVLGPDGPAVARQWQHFWAWPGRPRVGLLTLASVCPGLWPRLGPVFEACVASFRWTFPPADRAETAPSGAAGPPH
jgi:hypothetical protein